VASEEGGVRHGAFLGWLLAFALAACAGRQGKSDGRAGALPDPGPIRPPAALPYDFQWRQRVTAEWPEGKESFEAVLQKRGGELLLLGLSPMGLPGFVLTLREDGSIAFDNRTDTELPFPPAFILADVQRVFFPWLEPVQAGFEGERSGTAFGLEVRERYREGRLVSRVFQWADAPEKGTVRVDYEGLGPEQGAPERVLVTNGWFNYRLRIETLTQSRL
jgi:hypothetical protein